MKSTLVSTFKSSESQTDSYLQAVQCIQNYCAWIINRSVADPGLNSTLETIRVNAGAWYNTIYPTYLNMPSTILTSGNSIDNDFDMLISLANQEKNNSTPEIAAQIIQYVIQYASLIIETIQSLETQIKSLSSSISDFQSLISTDRNTLQNTGNSIQYNINSLNCKLSSLHGQLNSLEHAVCPNKNAINACRNEIDETSKQLETFSQASTIFSQAISLSSDAVYGALYLSRYWSFVDKDICSCITSLNKISKETGIILSMDLQSNKTRWDNFKSEFKVICQKLS